MNNDTTNPTPEQPITVYGVVRYLSVMDSGRDEPMDALPVDSPLIGRDLELARVVECLADENETLHAQVSAHEDADRRMMADLRAVEADRDELRRDYGDLIALDTEGLRSRIVALEDAAEQHRMNLEAAHAETIQYRDFWKGAIDEITALKSSADARSAAEYRKLLETMLDEARRENEADCAEFSRVIGQPVADRIAEYRHTIRQLTAQLHEALDLATHHALRTGQTVDTGCSRDPARYDVSRGHPFPACPVCGADEDGDCQAGVR